MSDIASELVNLDARVATINAQLEELLQTYNVHSAARDEASRRMEEINAARVKLRIEREGLSKLRESAGVKQRLVTAEEAAVKAKSEAEAITARLADKEKELDAIIAKAKEAAEQKA